MKRTILIAGMGTSPAVLTETVWALAHQQPAVIPDEIVVLVTKSGQTKLCREILEGEPSVWERMCADSERRRRPVIRSTGRRIETGPVHLKSKVELHFEDGSTLVFSDDHRTCLPTVHW